MAQPGPGTRRNAMAPRDTVDLSVARQEQRYQTLVQHSPYCIHEIGLDGALLSMNPAGLRMMRVDNESEIRGMPYLEAVGEADRPRIATLLDAALRGEPSEFQFEAVNGLFFRSTFVPIADAYGQVTRLMGLTLDVTEEVASARALQQLNDTLERRVAERTLQLEGANAELEQRNRDLEQFAYLTSHDLQEPLRTITGLASLISREHRDQLDDDGRHAIGYITESADRMNRLITDLLDHSRLRRSATVEAIDCNRLLDVVVADLSAAVDVARAEIRIERLPTIHGQRTELHLLFLNLLGNAIKFRRPETPPEISVAATRTPDGWRFTVTDNGIGITPAHHERIFQIFQRLHGRDDVEGTGIGLAHCRKIVELHDGEIGVESAPGHGSVFFFTLQDQTR